MAITDLLRPIIILALVFFAFLFDLLALFLPFASVEQNGTIISVTLWKICTKSVAFGIELCFDISSFGCASVAASFMAGRAFVIITLMVCMALVAVAVLDILNKLPGDKGKFILMGISGALCFTYLIAWAVVIATGSKAWCGFDPGLSLTALPFLMIVGWLMTFGMMAVAFIVKRPLPNAGANAVQQMMQPMVHVQGQYQPVQGQPMGKGHDMDML